MLVYLLRHAAAQEHASSDSARELTTNGQEQARSVVKKFRQYSPSVERIICSPYIRAQQTAAALMPLFPELELVEEQSITPGGDVYAVMDAIENSGVQHLVMVSHNPFLSRLLSVLVDGTLESNRHVGNATLHCISLDVIAPGCGELLYSLTP